MCPSHHLDCRSIHIVRSHFFSSGAANYIVSAHCSCGFELQGVGATYVGASREFQADFAAHKQILANGAQFVRASDSVN